MTILDGVQTQAEKDRLLAAAMDPKALEYCEQLKSQGIDFEVVRVTGAKGSDVVNPIET